MSTWADIRGQRANEPGVRTGYERARRAYEIGRQVRALREGMGLSQAELAREAGTSQAAIARLEAGGNEPRISTLDRIAEVLGASLVVGFAEGEGKRPPTSREGREAAG